MGKQLSDSAPMVQQIVDLAGKDEAAQKKALTDFDKAGEHLGLGFEGGAHVLIPHPNGMPDLANLSAEGLKAGADDAAWAVAA